MSEVKRYICATLQMWDSIGQPARLNTEQLVVLASDFDRVTAERDALHVLLTAADERADVLEEKNAALHENCQRHREEKYSLRGRSDLLEGLLREASVELHDFITGPLLDRIDAELKP